MFNDKIFNGAGLYGLYSAEFCGKRGEKVLVFEYDSCCTLFKNFCSEETVSGKMSKGKNSIFIIVV